MKLIVPGLIISLCLIFEFLLFHSVSAQTETFPAPEQKTETGEPKNEKSNQQVSTKDLIHFGDLIEIDVVGSVEYDWRGKLNPEGFLSGITYLEEPLYALCRSEENLAGEVASIYAKFLANPQVVVRILDKSGRPSTVVNGAVKTPARFQIEREVKLNELLISAGGFNETASGEIEILRAPGADCSSFDKQTSAGPKETAEAEQKTKTLNIKIADLIAGDEKANLYILSGDYITVKKAQPIYIVGNIIEPRKLDSRENLTISRAVAAAGGLAKNGDPNKILVYRIIDGATKVIEVNFQNIKQDDENDIKLRPLDIVEILTKGVRKKPVTPIVDFAESNLKNTDLPLKIIR